ncbi:hypothetical protein EB796_023034 [Bugula neritina]|uniref:Uncharacterized protein n=1 Tax=Bugula neritina TaxID=10212 RepID=A0A7J7IZI5_BUGNE|nr:hypothetical protein EB796_023034 [Bugula neritina]
MERVVHKDAAVQVKLSAAISSPKAATIMMAQTQTPNIEADDLYETALLCGTQLQDSRQPCQLSFRLQPQKRGYEHNRLSNRFNLLEYETTTCPLDNEQPTMIITKKPTYKEKRRKMAQVSPLPCLPSPACHVAEAEQYPMYLHQSKMNNLNVYITEQHLLKEYTHLNTAKYIPPVNTKITFPSDVLWPKDNNASLHQLHYFVGTCFHNVNLESVTCLIPVGMITTVKKPFSNNILVKQVKKRRIRKPKMPEKDLCIPYTIKKARRDFPMLNIYKNSENCSVENKQIFQSSTCSANMAKFYINGEFLADNSVPISQPNPSKQVENIQHERDDQQNSPSRGEQPNRSSQSPSREQQRNQGSKGNAFADKTFLKYCFAKNFLNILLKNKLGIGYPDGTWISPLTEVKKYLRSPQSKNVFILTSSGRRLTIKEVVTLFTETEYGLGTKYANFIKQKLRISNWIWKTALQEIHS